VPTPPPKDSTQPGAIDPHFFGTLCGLFSALLYTGANAFLRAVHDCDPVWVAAIRAVPTVVVMAPVLAIMVWRRQPLVPSYRLAGLIVLGGLFGQLGGNISFQWSLHIIGVALSVPLCLGGMIVGAAILGRVVLYEPLTPRVLLALGLLLGAIFVLAFGARDASRAMATEPTSPLLLAGGVAAACGAGFCYATLNAILRYCTIRGAPLPTALFTVSAVGAISLSSLAWLRLGTAPLLATQPHDLAIMLAAGVCNTFAFIALTKSLQLTSVVYVNSLNATQATMAAVAGVFIFNEALSPWLAVGICLTIAGLAVLARAHQAMRAPVEP
jgi:drug/metabolite transporter, DME family